MPSVPKARKSFWTHPIELLGDMGNVESHFCPFGGNVNLVQDRCTVCAKLTIGSEIILDGSNVHLGDVAQLALVSVHLEVVLILMQDCCMVCIE
jgi:hypothetical protein